MFCSACVGRPICMYSFEPSETDSEFEVESDTNLLLEDTNSQSYDDVQRAINFKCLQVCNMCMHTYYQLIPG